MLSTPATTFVAEPGAHDMTTEAVIPAPRDVVFRCYIEPDLMLRWWGPAELTSTVDTFQPYPGGRWRIVQTDPDGNEYGFHGTVHDVVPNERIVQTFEFEGMPGHVCLESVTFADVDGGTKVVAHSVFQSVADRDGMADSGARDFAAVGMAQLAEVAASI